MLMVMGPVMMAVLSFHFRLRHLVSLMHQMLMLMASIPSNAWYCQKMLLEMTLMDGENHGIDEIRKMTRL